MKINKIISIFLIAFGIFSNSQNLWSQDETTKQDQQSKSASFLAKLKKYKEQALEKGSEYKKELAALIGAIILGLAIRQATKAPATSKRQDPATSQGQDVTWELFSRDDSGKSSRILSEQEIIDQYGSREEYKKMMDKYGSREEDAKAITRRLRDQNEAFKRKLREKRERDAAAAIAKDE